MLKIIYHRSAVTHKFTPDVSKWPARQNVVGCSERYAKHHKQQISHRQIYDENVRGGAH